MLSRFNEFESTFGLMNELRRRMDHVWNDFDPAGQSGASANARALSASSWPRLNLFDDGASLVLQADVPGLSDKDIHLTLNEGTLAIAGERRATAPEGYTAQRQERPSLKFSRSLTLPCKVDPERANAVVKDGVLTVTLAKAADAQPRQIAVRTE